MNNSRLKSILLSSLLSCACAATWAAPARISVALDKPGHRVAPTLWGIFFEDIKVGDKRQDIVRMALFKSLWLQVFSRAA